MRSSPLEIQPGIKLEIELGSEPKIKIDARISRHGIIKEHAWVIDVDLSCKRSSFRLGLVIAL
jgi:hypothetical protein